MVLAHIEPSKRALLKTLKSSASSSTSFWQGDLDVFTLGFGVHRKARVLTENTHGHLK